MQKNNKFNNNNNNCYYHQNKKMKYNYKMINQNYNKNNNNNNKSKVIIKIQLKNKGFCNQIKKHSITTLLVSRVILSKINLKESADQNIQYIILQIKLMKYVQKKYGFRKEINLFKKKESIKKLKE